MSNCYQGIESHFPAPVITIDAVSLWFPGLVGLPCSTEPFTNLRPTQLFYKAPSVGSTKFAHLRN